MFELAPLHPQIVHFVVALGFVGIALRLVSLTGRLAWTSPSATALLVLAALASVAAVKSGDAAHGPAERIPGAREMVVEHEEYGERARNLFLVVAALELAGLALGRRQKIQRGLRIASAVAGIAAGLVLYEAAEHGGELVYNYAGGVGTRSGDPADTERLLVAGLYHRARTAREAGAEEDAARLTEELARRLPGDLSVQLLAIESVLRDRHDPAGALARLDAMALPADDLSSAIRHGLLTAEALTAAGLPDSARAILTGLSQRYPENQAVRRALEAEG